MPKASHFDPTLCLKRGFWLKTNHRMTSWMEMKTTWILTTIAVGLRWAGAVPSNGDIFSGPVDTRRTHLVGTDKVRENRPECSMRVSNDVFFSTRHDLFRDSVANVARFAKIIPCQCRIGHQHYETRCLGNA